MTISPETLKVVMAAFPEAKMLFGDAGAGQAVYYIQLVPRRLSTPCCSLPSLAWQNAYDYTVRESLTLAVESL